MNFRVVSAIFRRNLSGYFSTPTGYVFICLFVFLCSMAAFWPAEFFSANLANLDQLNKWIAFILLVFIPAITMSIWADERRQGTDELLLTIPASDVDVVAGKFLAATGIFTISLLFSMFCNLIVLVLLSKWYLAYAVFFDTYFGYWLLGEAMLAVGMIASFLTSNLTVAFILGALFNLPLVVAQWSTEGLAGEKTARFLRDWSYSGQFRDFGLGVFSFSSFLYFAGLIALSLYACLVLIGRRHWSGGRDGTMMGWHYLLRFAGLTCAIIGLNALFGGHSLGRLDVSDDRVNSLSPETIEILKGLDPKQPVRVEVFFSPKLPEAYQRQRLQIETFLREMEKASDGKLAAKIVDVEPNTEEAYLAKQRFDIVPVQRTERERSSFKNQELFMGLAFTSGLNKQVVKFVEKDLPIEYELVRAIWAVNQPKRKKIGILATDADVMGTGGGNPMMRAQRASGFSSLVRELSNMYEISPVSPNDAIKLTETTEDEKGEKKEVRLYDAILAVQPSSLAPTPFKNFIEVVKSGQPTVIFEDPLPVTAQIPGTYAQKEAQRGQFGQESEPEKKGDINELWKLLGVEQERYAPTKMAEIEGFLRAQNLNAKFTLTANERDGTKILCTTPDNQFRTLGTPREVLFLIDQNNSGDVFSEKSPITAGLSKIILPFTGAMKRRGSTDFNYGDYRFSELIRTGKTIEGIVPAGVFQLQRRGLEPASFEEPNKETEYVVAYEIKGSLKAAQGTSNLPMADEGSPEKAKADKMAEVMEKLKQIEDGTKIAPKADAKSAPVPPLPGKDDAAKIHVTIMPDLDLLHNTFFELRERTDEQVALANDNVTLVLNLIDAMAGQNQFLEIRKRGVKVRSLALLDDFVATNALDNQKQSDEFRKEIEKEIGRIQTNYTKKIGDLETQLAAINPDEKPREYEEKERQLAVAQKTLEDEARADVADLQRANQSKFDKLDRDLNTKLESERQKYQYLALLLPPIPPLCVAFFVYFNRRSKEKEGHRKSRLL